MLKDALAVWKALEGQVRKTVKDMSGKNLQCERYDVTTAPNPSTGKIGVSQPFGNEIFVPYSRAVAGAAVGDSVMVFWWKSLSNAKAWYMGDAIGEGGGIAPVTSVNGQTGAVELDAADVGALPESYQFNVGDIFISTNSTSPAARFGGTWEQIKDTFLLAAGDTYTAGATGGAASHSHSAGSLAARISNIDNATYGFGLERVVVDGYNANIVQSTQYAGGWAASSTATTFGASVVGTTDGNSNMPPYLAVYVWKRIA